MSLSIKEMDDINVLLTEVSLELLGNQFYDIHGQARGTLRELYLPGVSTAKGYSAEHSDLVTKLNLDINSMGEINTTENTASQPINQAATAAADKQTRRTSMNLPPRPPPVTPATDEAVAAKSSSAEMAATRNVDDTIKVKVYTELARESKLSEEMKLQYFKDHFGRGPSNKDEYDIAQEFHALEKNQMMVDSGALIEMIKHIKSDPANARQINEIAASILHIKDDI